MRRIGKSARLEKLIDIASFACSSSHLRAENPCAMDPQELETYEVSADIPRDRSLARCQPLITHPRV